MGKIYKQDCKECNDYYEGRGSLFCSMTCRSSNKEWLTKMAKGHEGQKSWNKGKKGWKTNNALERWRENGGVPWNKGLSVRLSPASEFKKGDSRITGKNNPNWKGGISPKMKSLRRSREYKEWMLEVYKKWRWTCVGCSIQCQKGNIVAHHIKPFANFPDLRFSVDNGVVMCRSCHAKEHNPHNKFNSIPCGKILQIT